MLGRANLVGGLSQAVDDCRSLGGAKHLRLLAAPTIRMPSSCSGQLRGWPLRSLVLPVAVVVLASCDARRVAITGDAAALGDARASDVDSRLAAEPPPADGGSPEGAEPAPTSWRLCGTLGEGTIKAATYSPDGAAIAVAYSSGLVALHDAADGRLLTELGGGRPGLRAGLVFARGGGLLAATSGEEVIFWGAEADGSWKVRSRFATKDALTVVSPDGQRWAATTPEPGAVVRRVSDGAVILTLNGRLRSLAFSDDGAIIVDRDGAGLEILDQAGALVRRVATPPGSLQALSASGRWALARWSELQSKHIALWNTTTGAMAWRQSDELGVWRSWLVGDDGRIIVQFDGGVQVLRVEDGAVMHDLRRPSELGTFLALSPNGTRALGITTTGDVGVLELASGAVPLQLQTRPGPRGPILDVTYAPTARRIAAAGVNGHAAVWDSSTHVRVWSGHGASIPVTVTVSPRGDWLACSGDGGALISLRDSRSTGLTYGVPSDGTQPWMVRVAFSPGGDLLAMARDGGVLLFPFDGSSAEGILRGDVMGVAGGAYNPALAFSRDGALLATGPRLWRVADRTLVWSKPDAPLLISRTPDLLPDHWASFSRDGQRLVLAAAPVHPDATPQTELVSVADGRTIRQLRAGRHPVFSPDDRHVLAGSELIDVETGVARPLPFDAGLSTFADGWTIVAGGRDGSVRVYCPEAR